VKAMLPIYREAMDGFRFHQALQAVWDLIGTANKYIVVNEPWALAKDEANGGKLDSVLYNLLECLRILALVLRPVMPAAAGRMMAGLGLDGESDTGHFLDPGGKWGGLAAGTGLKPVEALFPRLESKTKKESKKEKSAAEKGKVREPSSTGKGLISFDAFTQLDLRVAEIVAAEPVKKSERLLALTVRVPEERVIVAGIAEYYHPSELIGRQVIVVANLKPAKLMGVTSQGMILAAREKVDGRDRLVLSTVSDTVAVGSTVS